MGYPSIKRHREKCLLWRRMMLGIMLFMVALSLVFIGQGNVASAASLPQRIGVNTPNTPGLGVNTPNTPNTPNTLGMGVNTPNTPNTPS